MTKSSSGRPLGENARMHLSTGSSQSSLPIEHGVNLRELNTFGLPATATHLVRIASDADVRRLLDHPRLGRLPKLVLGGGSNLVLTRDPPGVVMRVEVMGRRLVAEHDDAWVVEFGAGESWHDCVRWTLEQGWPGLENLALIPGTAGAAPAAGGDPAKLHVRAAPADPGQLAAQQAAGGRLRAAGRPEQVHAVCLEGALRRARAGRARRPAAGASDGQPPVGGDEAGALADEGAAP